MPWRFCKMSFLAILLVLMAVLVLIWRLLHITSADLPPGPWNLPIFGSLLRLDPREPHISLTQLSKKYGPIFSLQLGKVYTVVVSDAKLLKNIFMKNESLGGTPLYVFQAVSKEKGIIVTQGSLWKEQRKFVVNFLKSAGASKVSPNKGILQAQILEIVDDFVQYIKSKGDRVVLNPSEVLVHNVASVPAILFFGKYWQRDDQFWNRMLNNLIEAGKLAGFAGPLNFLPFLRFLPKYGEKLLFFFNIYHTMYDMCRIVIEDTKKEMVKKHNIITTFLNRKAKTNSVFTEQQLCHLLIDLFGASIESTTSSLLWMILYLAKYREVQTKIRQELIDVLQGNAPTIDDLPNLPFLEATIAEVARIRTVGPLGIPHSALEDMQVEGLRIPKGAMIMPLLWAIHMDPKVWDDPEKFEPERFLDDNGRFHKPECFIPFQVGKRMCPGEDLAKMVILSFVSAILLNFEITGSVECELNLDVVNGVTLTPKPQKLVFIKI